MNLLHVRSFGALSAGVLVLASLGVSQAKAGEVRGTLTLPFQVHWGNAVLEPGPYSLVLGTEMRMFPILHVSNADKTIVVLIDSSRAVPASGHSYLRVENAGSVHVVREFSLGSEGRVITFPVPKSVRKQMEAAQAGRRETVVTVRPGVAGR